jgi:hypothetical protein
MGSATHMHHTTGRVERTHRDRLRTFFEAAVVLSLLLSPLPSAAQDRPGGRAGEKDRKASLDVVFARGDRFVLHRTEKTEGKTTLTLAGVEKGQEQPISSSEEMLSENRVLEAVAGKVTGLEKKIQKARFETRMFGQEKPEKGKRALDGRTIVLRLEQDRTTVEKADKLPPEELAGLSLDPDPFLATVPRAEIPVGHAWDVPREDLERFLTRVEPGIEFAQMKASCRFDRIETRRGAECAALSIELFVDGKSENGLSVVTRMRGTIWIALAEKRYAGKELEGTFETFSETKEDGGAQMKSSGKIAIKEVIVFVR